MNFRSTLSQIGRILKKTSPYVLALLIAYCGYFYYSITTVEEPPALPPTAIRNVTHLYTVYASRVETPTDINQIAALVKNHNGPISIGGGRFSMGGQTAMDSTLQLDLRQFNKVLSFSKENKEITVQPGITWRMIQEYIDPHNLSIKVMQTYANFTVGGSLSVNVHGRYIGLGPIIYSVKNFKLILPNGNILNASPTENPEFFYGAIGGYGALGVIAEVTLSLAENVKVERQNEVMPLTAYLNYFLSNIRDDSNVVFHNADIYPNEYSTVRAVSYVKSNKPLTIEDRLQPADKSYRKERFFMWMVSELSWGKWFRENWLDPYLYKGQKVMWRNYEASYNVKELEPASRKNSTYVLQEYFVPIDKINQFVPKMGAILNRHNVNVINISIRHAKKDPGALMAWAKTEVFAFVLYYKQGTSDADKNAVAIWTRELIEAAVKEGGAYYLPYQIVGTSTQFKKAYPNADVFFALKKAIDPTYKFKNKLWDAYYRPDSSAVAPAYSGDSKFKCLFSSIGKSDSLFLFLQNVYGLYPSDQFHYLIKETTAQQSTDESIYKKIQQDLPSVTPSFWAFRYALPALKIQKKEIAQQTATLVGSNKPINGYLEVGTTGRYVNSLQNHFPIEGSIYLINDDEPSYSAQEVMERGQLGKIGTFYNLNNYNEITAAQIPDTSLDLVTVYIGLHHAPTSKLNGFVNSLNRVLRPGGKLVIRDHNVETPEFGKFVSVIHDVFYCGLGKTWDYTSTEIRNYTSSDSLTRYLEAHGFTGDARRLLQPNDPSKNTLMIFTKKATTITSEDTPIKGYKRDEAQTYLTLPEWFLVFSPDEYATYIKNKKPSTFPYFGSAKQFWEYYKDIYSITKEKGYAFNGGYHLMVFVIGTSYTVENFVKGAYETTAGRISEWVRGTTQTEEDRYAAKVAAEYVSFIRVDPWYEFDFYKRLKELWTIDLFGKNSFRKWERKIILSNEYTLKALYAYLIKLGTKEVYGDAETEVYAKVSNLDSGFVVPTIKKIKPLNDTLQLIAMPRYEEFQKAALALSKKGVSFYEIAGNDEILLTCIVPSNYAFALPHCKESISRPILTDKTHRRIGITAEVTYLSETLSILQKQPVFIEHMYDY